MATADSDTNAPYAATDLAESAVEMTRTPDGGALLTCPWPLDPYPDNMIVCLRRWAEAAPDRDFLCERGPDGAWRRVSYGEAARLSANIAQALIERGHGPDRPIAILSDNSIDHGLLMLGAMHVAIPVMPVSPAYSLMSRDHAKLRSVMAHHDPGILFVDNPEPFAAALTALDMDRVTLVTGADTPGAERLDEWPGAERLAEWKETAAGPEIEQRLAEIGPDTVAKILLTSGSTGQPKGVINTQRMMCSNQAMMGQVWPFLRRRPPVLVDWLPWNHTFGGNFCFNVILYNGGTLYIDDGRPAPGRFDATLDNLRAAPPTLYVNVPRGYDLLVPALEADSGLRDRLLRGLDILFFAGAALPQTLRERLEALSVAARGDRLPILTSLGATETGPAATYLTWDSGVWGNIGVPLPGCEARLAPSGDKLEARFRGPNVTPGYYREPELTRAAFDSDGFFGIGDAVRFLDADDAARGLVFDGRVAENFKLLSGTWVHAGTLRLAAISAAAPVVQDAVVTGHYGDEVGLLAFPNPAGCRSLCPDAPEDEPVASLIARPEIRARLAAGLAEHNAANPASSTRIARAMLVADPPAIDAGEITDKGYINQRAVLERRAEAVARLHAADPGPDVLVIA